MSIDVLDCLYAAQRFYCEGKRGKAARRLQQALVELKRPMQRLPAWVQPGVYVQWIGRGPHLVYKVTTVRRGSPNWTFWTERQVNKTGKETMVFYRQSGKRYWRRYIVRKGK